MANKVAHPNQIYVCAACGKRSQDKYGEQAIDPGWDESCMLKAVLCWKDERGKDGSWIAVPP